MRALDIYKKLGDKKGEADTLNSVGAVYMFQNDNKKRLEVNLRCQELRKEVGDLEGVASSEGNIGETYFEMGDFVNARKCFEICLSSEHASPQGRSWAYHNLGHVENLEKNREAALDYFKKGLELSQSAKYNVLIVDSYLSITEVYLEDENFEEAILNAEESLEVSRKIGAKEGEKKSLYYLSKIYEKKGQFEESLRYHKDYHTIDLEISRDTEIERLKTTQLKVAYDKIEDQKNELIDSIKYAERIQRALLTRDQGQQLLSKHFVFFQPKDIVSGDFYWYYEKGDYFYMAVADCTGHGVPGAFLTMLGTTFLNEIIALNEDATPAFILDRLRFRIIRALSQKNEDSESKDGMDISLLRFNVKTKSAEWAGAYNPLWVIRKEGAPALETSAEYSTTTNNGYALYEIKGDKFPIGIMENMKPFTNRTLKLNPDDSAYLFSDGFADQFGGERGKKFRTVNFKESLLELESISIEERGNALENKFLDWKGNLEQLDDVCIFGIQILARHEE
ncbi:MAG: tetratricopeptide repeat protein [Crocinitomicaceae bacterium]|nr:tetratricopeptide repeat protein [Crocinitomicaceae bacterium]